MKSNKKLDKILKAFYDKRDEDYIEIRKNWFKNISDNELVMLLDELNQDKKLVKIEDMWNPHKLMYRISGKGIIFYEEGGYTGKKRKSLIGKIFNGKTISILIALGILTFAILSYFNK